MAKSNETKIDKGKGKQRVELSESDTEDEDFNVSDQELYDSEESVSDVESIVSQEHHDEIAELFEEAQENGDRGDLVIGLRSGKRKQDVIIPTKSNQDLLAASSSKKSKQ
jgi:hypothetical protein